jgi:hypothetical protein
MLPWAGRARGDELTARTGTPLPPESGKGSEAVGGMRCTLPITPGCFHYGALGAHAAAGCAVLDSGPDLGSGVMTERQSVCGVMPCPTTIAGACRYSLNRLLAQVSTDALPDARRSRHPPAAPLLTAALVGHLRRGLTDGMAEVVIRVRFARGPRTEIAYAEPPSHDPDGWMSARRSSDHAAKVRGRPVHAFMDVAHRPGAASRTLADEQNRHVRSRASRGYLKAHFRRGLAEPARGERLVPSWILGGCRVLVATAGES